MGTGGGLKREEWGLINFLPLKRGGGLFGRGEPNRGFTVSESQVLKRSQYFFLEHVLMCVTSTCI